MAAAWVGELGVALLAVAVNGAVGSCLVPRGSGGPRGRRWGAAGFAALGVAVVWGVGAVRMATLEPAPVLRALAVQPAIPLELKRTEGPVALAAQVAATDALVPDAAPSMIDLVVLPETALPVALDRDAAAGVRQTVASWAARVGVPVAVGAYGSTPDGQRRTNAVFLAGPDPGATWPRADKRRLVRVITNLLDNARKYGGGATRVEVRKVDDGLQIAVEDAGPGVPEMKCEGKVTGRMLGGYWLVNEMKSNLGEVEMQALQTVGYDPEKKKYVGTWVDNMMNLMWHYEGSVDESGKILTLEAEGPNMMGGEGKSKYRDVYEFKSDDEIAATSQVQGPDGEWVTFMNGTYKRVKE